MTDWKLKYEIAGDNAKLKAAVKESDSLLSRLGSSGAGSLASLAGPAAIAGAGILAVGSAAISAGSTLFELTKAASDFGSEIFDATKKTQLSAETISAMKFAADQSGSSLEAITGGIAKFAKTVGAAAEDSQKAAEFIKAFGVDPKAAIEDLDGSLAKVFKRIQDAPPGIERMTLAQKAFGKSGADLLPFIDSFDGDLASLTKRAKELGVTINDEAARAADEFGDQLDTLSAQFSGVGRTVGTAFMPVFADMAKSVSSWIADNQGKIQKWGQNTADALRGATSAWNELTAAAKRYYVAATPDSSRSILKTIGRYNLGTYLRRKGESERIAMGPSASAGISGMPKPGFDDEEGSRRAAADRQKAFDDELKNRSQQNQLLLRAERDKYSEAQKNLETALSEKAIAQSEYDQKALANVEAYYQRTRNLLFQSFKDESKGKSGTALKNEQLEYANAVRALDSEVAREREGIQKRSADSTKKATEDLIANAEKAVDRTLEIYRSGYEQRELNLEASLKAQAISESEYVRQVDRIRLEAFVDEQGQLKTLLADATITGEKRAEIEHRLAVLSKNIATQKMRNAIAWGDAIKKEVEDSKAAVEVAEETLRRATYDRATSNRQTQSASSPAGSALDRANQQARYAREQLLADLDYARQNLKLERDAALERAKGLKDEVKIKAAINEAFRLKELDAEEEYQRKLTEIAATYAKEREEAAAEDNRFKQFSQNWNNLLDEMAGSVGVVNIIDTVGAAGVDMFANMAQAAGSAVEMWALYGDSVGTALKKALAAELAHMAGVAVVKAIYATALGFLLLAEQNYPAAANAFISAGIWAGIAGASALGAKAIAGDSFKGNKAGSSNSSGNDQSFGSNVNQNPTPYSRQTATTFQSGRDYVTADLHRSIAELRGEVANLNGKLSSMSPGDVLTTGAKQRKGFLINQVTHEASSNAAAGIKLLRTGGVRR